ncbi:hypothetical protein DMN77_18740 [Paenibacillus sp. 79R4]|nr:hypothetical protein [Paenibacillus sp. 79R4]
MVKNFAKFTATMGKGIKVGDSDVEIKLTLPLKVVQENFMFLSTNQGEKVNVFLGDPQMAWDFNEEEEDMYKTYTGGRQVTADASGVVTSVQQPDEEKDENQAELFTEDGQVPETDSEEDNGQNGKQPEEPDSVNSVEDEPDDYEREILGEMDKYKESGEMTFEEGHSSDDNGSDQSDVISEDVQSDGEEVEISKEQLEEFILQQRPTFPEFDLDFADLLKKRRDGSTWLGLSKELGIPSSQLNTKYRKYKDKVKQMMKDNGAA